MKYIKKLIININQYISKDFLNKNFSVDQLMINNTWTETNASTYFATIYSDQGIVKDNNFNEIKNFLDTSNPDEYPKIRDYDFYHDFISTQFINYIKNKNIKINLDNYILKSAEESYRYLLHNQKTVSFSKKEELIKAIFRNRTYKCKYAAHILQDRLPQYEEELLKLNLGSDIVNMYLKNVLIHLINVYHDLNERTKKFEEFYRKSELYRKLIDFNINEGLFRSLKISHRSDILDDLALKHTKILESYLEEAYLNSGEPIKSIHQELSKFVEKINKVPEAIVIYYRDRSKKRILHLPENKKIIETLMTDPDAFTRFIIGDIYMLSLEKIEELFPDYKKVVSKIDDLILIKDFFTAIQHVFFKGNRNINFKADHETFKKLREYIYNNYSELIEKTSKSALYSYYFACIMGAPFKEGEPVIFKETSSYYSYLRFLKDDLGPDLVPDYDRYDFSELDKEEDDDIGY